MTSSPPFNFSDAAVPAPSGVAEAFAREWQRLSEPGASLTGEERVRVAAAARDTSSDANDATSLEGIAATVSHRAHHIDQNYVETATGSDIPVAAYIEICGIVSRLSAVDTFVRGLGLDDVPLPSPQPGTPSGEIDATARVAKSFVPVVGPAGAITALSMVPGENAARHEVHEPLYITMEQMQDPGHADVMTRAQMELVASRTSHLNHCQY